MLLLCPEREYAQTELATLLKAPLTTVQREVELLANADLNTERRVGRARLAPVVALHYGQAPLVDPNAPRCRR
jgi:hypothetical protein